MNLRNTRKYKTVFLGNNGYIYSCIKEYFNDDRYIFTDIANLKKVIKDNNNITSLFFLYGPNRSQCHNNFSNSYKRYTKYLNQVLNIVKTKNIWIYKLSTIHAVNNEGSNYAKFYNKVDAIFLKKHKKSSIIYLGNIFGIIAKNNKFEDINFIHKYMFSYIQNKKFIIKDIDSKRNYTPIYFLLRKIKKIIFTNYHPSRRIVVKKKLISNRAIINLITKKNENVYFSKEFIYTIKNLEKIYLNDIVINSRI